MQRFLIFSFLMVNIVACSQAPDMDPTGLTQTTYPYSEGDDIPAMAYIEHDEVYNPESVIPPQCYTATNGTNNPCYACHQSYDKKEKRPNQMGDGNLQGNYEFSDVGLTNSWKNLFVDRRALIANISQNEIDTWVNQDNYSAAISPNSDKPSTLPETMRIKGLAFPQSAFYENGLAKDGSDWVAFNYKPFPSTFWPTNGSTGDVMIRLTEKFRSYNGKNSEPMYLLNLSLVEIAMKDLKSISIPATNEIAIQIDLDMDGTLSQSTTIMARRSHYLGEADDVPLAKMLYPEGTEFLHTVRYIGVKENGEIFNAPRMKEVRYMRKHKFRSRESLASAYYAEAKDKHFEQLPQTRYLGDRGIDNGFGWTINGFIEDQQGQLRAQHKQELAYCNGCHKSVGATFDQSFSFARKVPGALGWGYINLKEIDDVPNIGESEGEFLTYMERVGGGDEFRQNSEMLAKWFDEEGNVLKQQVRRVPSLYQLIMPSAQRARDLNKAYFTIVKEQSYLFGRDATLVKAKNVLQQIDSEQPPLLPQHRHKWDMRLDWSQDEGNDLVTEAP